MTRGKVARFAFAALALSATSSALAADKLKFGPPPSWVAQTKAPNSPKQPGEAPFAVLLNDQQVHFEPGKSTVFNETMIKIQSAQGLSAGNVSIPWNPATDTVTVHRLHILRGGQVIDVLANQQFTTIRRESNLEAAMLDGRLTATIQPEGLQEGDIVDFAATLEHADPVTKDHVEAQFANWDGIRIGLGRVRLIWPVGMKLKLRQSNDLPKARTSVQGGKNIAEFSVEDIQPLLPAKGAPPRFLLGRVGEASDFASWSEIADLFAPLYKQAAIVPSSGPLRDEVERIRKETGDPRVRTQMALALVQDRVRYVALFMGNGSYVPVPAETTWSRRFGDCKGKTALLLAILHELGIQADAALVHSALGDAIPERLPMVGLFDHVLVRARIDGETYWLDGTRTGDSDLERLLVPGFRWALPLVAGAKLVSLVQVPLVMPDSEQLIDIDARAGVFAPAAVTIEQIFRGADASVLNSVYSQLTPAQRDELLRQTARREFDDISPKSSSFEFDKAKGEVRLTIKGDARLKWDDGWYFMPSSTVGYEPNFDRSEGPNREAPFAVAHPSYSKRRTTIQLPTSFAAGQKGFPTTVKETLAGVEYERRLARESDQLIVEVRERSLMPELSYARAKADEPRLRAIYDEDIHLKIPDGYRASDKDLEALRTDKPASAAAYFDRGLLLLNRGKYDEAISDFTESLKLDPKDVWTIANRGLANFWKRDVAAAERDLAAAEAIDAENPVALRTRGLLAETKGDLAAAVDAYTKSFIKNPKNAFTRTRRGLVLLTQGKTDEALADLNQAVASGSDGSRALAGRALVHVRRQDLKAAEEDVARSLALEPDNMSALAVQGQIEEGRRDYKAALETYSKLLEKHPADRFALLRRATVHRALGNDAQALADTEVAIKAGQTDPNFRLLRANIFRKQGNRDAASKEADRLAEDHPKLDFAQVSAARIYSALGMKQQAMQAFDAALAIRPAGYIYLNRAQSRPISDEAGRRADLDAALKLEPDNGDVLAMQAWMLSRESKFDEAARLYDQAIAKMPDATYFAIDRAIALFKAGKLAEATSALSDIRSKATTATDFNNLCWSKATANVLLDSALADCREALRLEPEAGPYLDSLGMVLLRLGKLDEALTAYNQAIDKNTGAASLMGRAIVHLGKGDKARAETDRAEAIKLNPDVESEFAGYALKFSRD